MQLGKVINLNKCGNIIDFFKSNKSVIILLGLFLSGFILGIFSLDTFEGYRDFFAKTVDSFIDIRNNESFFKIFSNSFFGFISYLILFFIAGSSVLGVVFIPFLVFFGGLYFGGIMSFLYSEYALSGVAFSAVMVVPSAVLFGVSIILSAREAIGFSVRLSKLTFPRTVPANLYYDFKNYCGRFIVIFLLVLFSSLTDGLIAVNLAHNFSL